MSIEPSEATAEELLEREQEIEDLSEHLEAYVRENSDERLYFSTDVASLTDSKVTIGVYGVEGHPMPSKRLMAEAVGEFYDWKAGFEEGRTTSSEYVLRVLDFEETQPVFET